MVGYVLVNAVIVQLDQPDPQCPVTQLHSQVKIRMTQGLALELPRVLYRWPTSLHQGLQAMSYLVGASDRILEE